MIKIENVSKEIKNKIVLKQIDLHFEEGNCYMLHGHNGSGKTMLLRLIGGLIQPTSGSIYCEKSIRFGVIIEPAFFEHETAYYNLKYLASINCVIDDEMILQWLKTFNLFNVKDNKVKTYSLGMKQRLALCQAFMEDPDVILLDEPFNAVDEDNLQIIYKVIREIKQKGKIVIIASHVKIPDENLIDVEIKMNQGQIAQVTKL